MGVGRKVTDLMYSQLVQQMFESQQAMPYLYQQLGYNVNPKYLEYLGVQQKWAQAQGPEKREFEQQLKSMEEQGYNKDPFTKMTDEERLAVMTPQERATYDVGMKATERLNMALEGKLPVSPALEAALTKQEEELRNVMSARLGPGWETSTPGIQAMGEMRKQHDLLREEARRGMIDTSSAVSLAQTGFGRALTGQNAAYLTTTPMRNLQNVSAGQSVMDTAMMPLKMYLALKSLEKGGSSSGGMGSGILSGAASGAATGSMFGPWGAVIGGVAGGALGAFSSRMK